MFILIIYCQKRTDMNYSLYSATLLHQEDFQSMPHDLLNTNCWKLNNCINEQNIVGFQFMVYYNNRDEEMCRSKRKQSSFQWLGVKNIGLA